MTTDEVHSAFPDEGLPEGSVVDGEAIASDVDEAFDFVIVGSGAAGAVAAHVLSKAGWSVAIVEEGPGSRRGTSARASTTRLDACSATRAHRWWKGTRSFRCSRGVAWVAAR